MNIKTLAVTAVTLCLLPSQALAIHASHGEHGHCEGGVAQPLLTVADFDGNGIVDGSDIQLLTARVNSGEYTAIFDRNADGVLDEQDIVAAAQENESVSTAFDRELVAVFNATERYRDLNNAIADGYRPFTPELAGHGFHYTRLPIAFTATGIDWTWENWMDSTVEITKPEGLNYDENGQLVAVFYYHGINVLDWILARTSGNMEWSMALAQESVARSTIIPLPTVFSNEDELWHHHYGACWAGLDYPRMQVDPTWTPGFNQQMTYADCVAFNAAEGQTATGWIPAMNMMHLWVHTLNECGVFSGTDPHVSHDAPEEPLFQPLMDWFAAMGISM